MSGPNLQTVLRLGRLRRACFTLTLSDRVPLKRVVVAWPAVRSPNGRSMVRLERIELSNPVWETDVIPFHHRRFDIKKTYKLKASQL